MGVEGRKPIKGRNDDRSVLFLESGPQNVASLGSVDEAASAAGHVSAQQIVTVQSPHGAEVAQVRAKIIVAGARLSSAHVFQAVEHDVLNQIVDVIDSREGDRALQTDPIMRLI